MKKHRLFSYSIIFFCLYWLSASAFSDPDLSKIPKYAPDRILVGFKPGTSGMEMRTLHSRMGAKVMKTLGAIGVDVVSVPPGSVQAKVDLYKKNQAVKFVEPDYYRSFVVPDEGQDVLIGDYFDEQWPLQNTGQLLTDPTSVETAFLCYLWIGVACPVSTYTGTSGADINALTGGGELVSGDPSVTIAILDSGIDCSNKDFQSGASLSKCIDDQVFNGVSPDTNDELPHGTLVASIAAANAGDSAGIAGVAQGPQIANLKVCYPYDTTGLGDYVGLCPISASAAAILYAANAPASPNALNHPYEVINMSYGSDCPDITPSPTNCPVASQAENDAIQFAWSAGSVIVAAAGNDYGTALHYPAAYNNVIAVASSDYNDNLSSFSTYGNSWVELLAPGTNIVASAPDLSCQTTCAVAPSFPGCPFDPNVGCVGYASGTSLSSPHVAGVAAMVWSELLSSNPGATNADVRDCILNHADTAGASGQNFLAWTIYGKVNLQDAMDCSPLPPPPALSLHIGDLDATTRTVSGNRWRATVRIYVRDQNNVLKPGVTVTGQWSVGGTSSCITGNKGGNLGSCSVSKTMQNSVPNVTFTVTNASLNGYNYNPDANVNPDGGNSNGTAITVTRP